MYVFDPVTELECIKICGQQIQINENEPKIRMKKHNKSKGLKNQI
jgi:hypothetical protein